jgi:nucleoside-diphosphate-sugar epimerase
MRIAITGATGNVGTALLRRLAVEPDIDVVGLARRIPGPDAGPPYENVEWHSIDVGDRESAESLARCFSGVDAVVHLAWQTQPSHRRAQLRRTNLAGTRHVIDATRRAGVRTFVLASSVGAYMPGPKDQKVDESWPAAGVPTSGHSIDKAAVELMLDGVEREHPGLRVVRLRKALVFQRDAGAEITRYFLGPSAPVTLRRIGRIPLVPANKRLRTQAVHADDAADAYVRTLRSDVRGPFNIATEPVLDGQLLAEVSGGRAVRVPLGLIRVLAKATWRTRLQPTEAGWFDLIASVPLMDCSRAARELGWEPRHDTREALRDLLEGIAEESGTGGPAMRPGNKPARARNRLLELHRPV